MKSLKEKINGLPNLSGVYLYKDKEQNIIYVGKAKNLKKRVSSYFISTNKKDIKTQELVKNIVDLDFVVTTSELDAFVLENTFIKKHQPYYNILLKDSKSYPYIKINFKENFPTFEITRKIEKDSAKYFGPYLRNINPNDILEIIHYAYPIIMCGKKFPIDSHKRECLNYSLGLCSAPCNSKISKTDYEDLVKNAIKFLNGENEEIRQVLINKMNNYANLEQFESAIKYRDILKNLDKITHTFTVDLVEKNDIDVFGFYSENNHNAISILIIRKGRMVGYDNYILPTNNNINDTFHQFLIQYYSDKLVPNKIITNLEISDDEALEEFFINNSKHIVNISKPLKGKLKQLTDVADKNAVEYLKKQLSVTKLEEQRTIGAIESLKEILHLQNLPHRIEGYDISNISGQDKVSSMVVFIDGKNKNKLYRKFKIKTVEGANDFASMKETLTRRLERLYNKENNDVSFSEKPDLIVIDGGKGQLSAVQTEILKYGNIDVVGLAKKNEEVYLPNKSAPIMINKNNFALQLLQRVRDESHRFAKNYFKTLHTKQMLFSIIDEIDGVGKTIKQRLIEKYKNINNLKATSIDELAKVDGVSIRLAQKILSQLKGEMNE